MSEAYSPDGVKSVAPPSANRDASPRQLSTCSTQRRGYSSSGMPNRSIRSARPDLMNHGTYSAKCSDDSVGK